ncbi:MAG: hypothetical protein IPM45_15810 [Acidimicrobiales bacterium]|nr:hypothetical protein [Acidimicrobiales bacterium]
MSGRTATSTVRYGEIGRDYAMRLAATPPDEDGPVWMVNLMKYRPRAEYADGRSSDLSGREADDLYAPTGPLAAVGAEVVFVADVDTQLLGQPTWDRIGVVKYPTRRAFIDMQSRPDFVEKHAHKDAGMEQTIVIGCQPLPFPEPSGRTVQPEWTDVPHPPTDDDGPVVVVHVIRFQETDGVTLHGYDHGDGDHMAAYQREAEKVAVPHGVRIAGWLAAEGTIVGDGRQWDQVRFNAFPSRRAFMAVALDPERLEAQAEHRETAIADTFAIITRPVIDTLTRSIEQEDGRA